MARTSLLVAGTAVIFALGPARAEPPAPTPRPPTPIQSGKRSSCNDCDDGQATAFYFHRDNAPSRTGGAEQLVPDDQLFAKFSQSCACTSTYLNQRGKLVEVTPAVFDEAIKAEQRACGNCLLVQRLGSWESGRVFDVASNRPLDGSPTGVPLPAADAKKESLSQSDIMEVVLENKKPLADCVADQQKREPQRHGKLLMQWTIQPSGQTRNITVLSNELRSTALATCVTKVIGALTFAPHRIQGDPVQFPFKF